MQRSSRTELGARGIAKAQSGSSVAQLASCRLGKSRGKEPSLRPLPVGHCRPEPSELAGAPIVDVGRAPHIQEAVNLRKALAKPEAIGVSARQPPPDDPPSPQKSPSYEQLP